jgi:hypothetical protein
MVGLLDYSKEPDRSPILLPCAQWETEERRTVDRDLLDLACHRPPHPVHSPQRWVSKMLWTG